MELRDLGPGDRNDLEQALGYLNFSAGAGDSQFLASINQLFKRYESVHPATEQTDDPAAIPPTWITVGQWMRDGIADLRGKSAAFQDTQQASRVLDLLIERLLPGYLEFHSDLLFHQTDRTLFRPFFVGRACEAILTHQASIDDDDELTKAALTRLNDYVGYRPVAVLESRTYEPHAHERVRPVPLYVEGAGVAVGRYYEVITRALRILQNTDPSILRAAFFHPEHLSELAMDPRAYDFDHPVNKRPNYHFGQWDPHAIDQRGFYCRFVVQQVTLDALMNRVASEEEIPLDERLTEGAAVLAGTILMASGISGAAPDSHDSGTTLGNLLPRIAAYRDAFYEHLIHKLDSPHAQRLQREAKQLRQPFGAARQHINAQLTRRRASQLEHVRLANIFARMGFLDAAQRQIDAVPVASARMLCQLDCNLTSARQSIEVGDLTRSCNLLNQSRDLLERAIQCGAVIDPWSILGFDGNFSLFPAIENSVHDHRVDELIDLMEETFDTYGKLWSTAAAVDDAEVSRLVAEQFGDLAKWWHQFAAHEVGTVDCCDPLEVHRATESVAEALKHWHQGGEATGAIGFWAPHVGNFDSPKAYSLVIQMLLNREDYVAARGLLVHWLSQVENVPLEHGDHSFQSLCVRWLCEVLRLSPADEPSSPSANDWQRVSKFFDYVEANAGEYWHVPDFTDDAAKNLDEPDDGWHVDDQEEEEPDIFSAAYEDVVYRDSTDDGIEGNLFDSSGQYGALDETHDQIVSRLSFLNCLARMWKIAAMARMTSFSSDGEVDEALDDAFQRWFELVRGFRRDLENLLANVNRHRLTQPNTDFVSMAEFDRERMIKESLLEHVIGSIVEMAETGHTIVCVIGNQFEPNAITELSDDEVRAAEFWRAAWNSRGKKGAKQWQAFIDSLRDKPILYVPLVRGGSPKAIVAARIRQQLIRNLLSWLPRLRMLTETRELIEMVRFMERSTPTGPGAVTEFDNLFEVGFRAMVECLIRATNVNERQDLAPTTQPAPDDGTQLVSCLENLTESMLVSWLSHSRTLRLSVLEKVKNRDEWQELVSFVKRYGSDLFTQQFLSLANVRGILYEGVDAWLDQLLEMDNNELNLQLLDELETNISREEVVKHLSLVLESIVENYPEYRDYNSTTTQSDRGDLLYNLLDFLRLLGNYERIVWNLKPVVISHELLVRHGCNQAAQMWRRALSDRIGEEANRYEKKLVKLQQRYAMRLPTIADRIGERFLRPMVIDRMRSLVEPAMKGESENAFTILEDETALLMRQPSGVGFDPPMWLIALDEEVQRVRRGREAAGDETFLETLLPPMSVTTQQVQKQIDSWGNRDFDDM